jgi:all-trans-8'-apo-beta-carotenal 15,15'-oxygenase
MTGFAIDGARGSVRVTSRLVATPRLAAQQAAGEEGGFTTRGAWTQATAFWRNLFALPTNPSNTSALRWAGKLMALCEGGAPMELDPVTLQTRGPVTFSGQERQLSVLGFGAHFKIDPVTRVLYNIGVQLPSALRIFALSPDGREVAASSISFPAGELSFVHDWAMSANHLVLFIPPWYCGPMEALASVVGLRALGHAFTWRAGRPTRCVVLRKRDLAVVHDSEVPAFSTYHFANALEEGSVLKVHVNRLLGDRAALEANFSNMYSAEWQARTLAGAACAGCADASRLGCCCGAQREQYNELVEFALDLSSPASRVTGGQPVARGAMPMEFPIVSHRYAARARAASLASRRRAS